MKIYVYESDPKYWEWAVECITGDSDGSTEKTIFCGPRAEERARKHCLDEYGLPGLNIDLSHTGITP